MAAKTASYRHEPVQDGVRFHVSPAPFPLPWVFILAYAAFGLVALFAFFASRQIIMLFIAAGLGFLVWRTVQAGQKGRETSIFDVTQTGIKRNQMTIGRAQLHELRIDNDISHEQTVVPVQVAQPTMVVGGMLPDAYIVQHGTSLTRPGMEKAAAGYKKLQRDVSWRVDAEAGGVATRLAGGMDLVTARGLVTDVQRALNGALI